MDGKGCEASAIGGRAKLQKQIPPGSLRSRVGMTMQKQIPPGSLRSRVGMTMQKQIPPGFAALARRNDNAEADSSWLHCARASE